MESDFNQNNICEFLVEIILNRKALRGIVDEITQQNSIFSDKSYLDNLCVPSHIVGREEQTRQIVDYLLGYKKGLVVPFVSIYGRSGSGKSSLVRFVCENLDDVIFCYVNLRKAKTVFGCANLILSELGETNLKSAQGLNNIVDSIYTKINSDITSGLFVLCLDEFDTLFLDKRGRPSDFVYKLLLLIERLRSEKKHLCIITISNKILSEFDLDDRVISRIGSSDVYFDSYSKEDVYKILYNRAKHAFSKKISDDVLRYCSSLSSSDHGDARRALDLLRASAEIASRQGKNIATNHVDMAIEQLQQDQVSKIINGGSYHFRLACAAISRLTFLSEQSWHSTSVLYKQYQKILQKDTKPLSYRRVSELLVELVNSGIAISQTHSKGRQGYGSQFKLAIEPEIIGRTISSEWWNSIVSIKETHDSQGSFTPKFGRKLGFSNLSKALEQTNKRNWDQLVGK